MRIRSGFGITNPLSARGVVRENKVDKKTAYGRHIGIKSIVEGDRVYGISFHATKGPRRRRVYDASVRRRLLGI